MHPEEEIAETRKPRLFRGIVWVLLFAWVMVIYLHFLMTFHHSENVWSQTAAAGYACVSILVGYSIARGLDALYRD